MFTGLIEEIGEVVSAGPVGNGVEFRFRAPGVRTGMQPGDSIAIDGACMTAACLFDDGFAVQTVATSLQRTIFGGYRPGRRVNLERALAVGSRLGGHLVQGHVDAVGEVLRIAPRDELVLIEIAMPLEVAEVTVLHGSVAVNGISLTVNHLPAPALLGLSIIPFTWEQTTLADLRVADRVNLEGDTIGKYVRHLLGAPAAPATAGAGDAPQLPDLLRAWGY